MLSNLLSSYDDCLHTPQKFNAICRIADERYEAGPNNKRNRLVKRLLDVSVALTGLVMLAPLLGVLAIAVAVKLGRPVLFRQKRPGLHAETFELVKFRTMRDAVDARGEPLPDAERLTPFGHWLRSTSLDELPSLINILRGDLSLVGPRPLLVSYLPHYSAEQARRHDVRPGLTGWAQINGRNSTSWEKRFRQDVWYVDNRSFLLDLKILWRTFSKVRKREGISAEGHATMPHFGEEIVSTKRAA
jgi:lipopolysaccharide/colanic/teichoic acid biosynthesis glycosyltransferase